MIAAKKRYDHATAVLKELLDKRDAIRKDEILSAIVKSGRSYEEIMNFLNVEETESETKDIINLPHPVSKNHPQMPLQDRAAQFAPFAALTGHDAAIKETARLTDERLELSEEMITQLNEKINIIRNNMGIEQNVLITYFVPDAKKTGGSYVTRSGIVKKIDEYEHTIIMTDQTAIPIEQISDIKCEERKKKLRW